MEISKYPNLKFKEVSCLDIVKERSSPPWETDSNDELIIVKQKNYPIHFFASTMQILLMCADACNDLHLHAER